MRNLLWVLVLAVIFVPVITAKPPQHDQSADPPPAWAYGFPSPAGTPGSTPPVIPPPPDDGTLRHLPTSTLAFTLNQIRDGFGPADWYPGDHPRMPDVVAHGRKPEVRACSLCHYPNGKGRPENAGIAGLPYSYIMQTMADFKSGARKSADSRKANTIAMAAFAKAMTDDEVKAAAGYFSAMKWTPWIKVVETEMVPKTRIAGGMFLALDGNEKEPLGDRIIEVPEDTEKTELLRDSRSGFIAYVPVGSVKKGEELVVSGGAGKTIQCAVCHGTDLRGLGPVPGIAGHSPSYIVRQLYDMQHGSRAGVWTELMKPVVAKLNNSDMLAIAAYLASRGDSSPSSPSAMTDSLVQQGAVRFKTYGCDECHGSVGEGTEDGPALTTSTLTPVQLSNFLEKPSAGARLRGMPDVPATNPDLQPLLAYVLSVQHSHSH